MKTAAWFFTQRSPGIKRHREEAPPPLSVGLMLTEFSPCVPVRLMFGCVVIACRRLATAPAGMHEFSKTMGRWVGWILERVTRGRVRRVQVQLLRRACCDVRCPSRASACVRYVFHACCRKRWLIFRLLRIAAAASSVYSCVQAAAAARVADRYWIGHSAVAAAESGDGSSVLCHVIADADGVNKRDRSVL
jgi:hypothetical protein